jgi:hypothetical protein
LADKTGHCRAKPADVVTKDSEFRRDVRRIGFNLVV